MSSIASSNRAQAGRRGMASMTQGVGSLPSSLPSRTRGTASRTQDFGYQGKSGLLSVQDERKQVWNTVWPAAATGSRQQGRQHSDSFIPHGDGVHGTPAHTVSPLNMTEYSRHGNELLFDAHKYRLMASKWSVGQQPCGHIIFFGCLPRSHT